MVERFWGVFGWIHYPLGPDAHPISNVAVVLATSMTVLGIVAALLPHQLRGGSDPGPGPRRTSLLALCSVLPLLVLLVAGRAWDLYTTTSAAIFIHGRYLFAGVAALAVAVGVGLARSLRRSAPLAVLVGAVLMQVEGIRVGLDSWWSGRGTSVRYSFAGMRAWNPWFDHWPTLLAVVAVALVGVLGWDLGWGQRARAASMRRAAATTASP